MTLAVNHAQKISDDTGRESRRTTRLYGESMKVQREKVYAARRLVQDRRIFTDQRCMELIREQISEFFDSCGEISSQEVVRFALDNITYGIDRYPDDAEVNTREKAEQYLTGLAGEQLSRKNLALGDGLRETYFRMMTLKAIDECWIEEVDYLEQLKHAMSARQYTRQNVLYDFHREAGKSYEHMRSRIARRAVRNILLGEIQIDAKGETQVVLP